MLTKLLMSRSNKFSSFVGRIYKFRRSYIIYLRMWCTIKLRLILIQFVHVHSCTMVRVYICMWNPETNTDYLCTLFSILCFEECFHTYQTGWPIRHSNPPHSISLKSGITGVCSCNNFYVIAGGETHLLMLVFTDRQVSSSRAFPPVCSLLYPLTFMFIYGWNGTQTSLCGHLSRIGHVFKMHPYFFCLSCKVVHHLTINIARPVAKCELLRLEMQLEPNTWRFPPKDIDAIKIDLLQPRLSAIKPMLPHTEILIDCQDWIYHHTIICTCFQTLVYIVILA